MSLRPSHLGICVSDVTASMRFWCDGLGFEVAEGYDLDTAVLPGLAPALEVQAPIVMRSQMIRLADLKIEIISYTSPDTTGTPSSSRGAVGFTHLSSSRTPGSTSGSRSCSLPTLMGSASS